MSKLDEIKAAHERLGASHEDVEWLISEVERLQWFEENFSPVHQDSCEYCGCSLVAFCEKPHKPDCEYLKHKEKE